MDMISSWADAAVAIAFIAGLTIVIVTFIRRL